MTATGRGVRSDRAQASVVVIGAVAAILLTAIGVLEVTSAVARAHRAHAAADFAALAGAQAIARGAAIESACGSARRLALANGATLETCVSEPGGVVSVTVSVVGVGVGVGGRGPAVARARAGP